MMDFLRTWGPLVIPLPIMAVGAFLYWRSVGKMSSDVLDMMSNNASIDRIRKHSGR